MSSDASATTKKVVKAESTPPTKKVVKADPESPVGAEAPKRKKRQRVTLTALSRQAITSMLKDPGLYTDEELMSIGSVAMNTSLSDPKCVAFPKAFQTITTILKYNPLSNTVALSYEDVTKLCETYAASVPKKARIEDAPTTSSEDDSDDDSD